MIVKELFTLVIFALVVNIASVQVCNGGVECIRLESCSGLYGRLTQGNNRHLTKLLKSLHCGFENDNPMICCPPEFESQLPDVPNRSNFLSSSEDIEPTSLLPDAQICGVQSTSKLFAEHPWTALLRYDKTYSWGFFCGGVLISSRYVLTTASCVIGLDLPSTWTLSQVRLGEWNTSSSTDCYLSECSEPHLDIPVEHVTVHDDYDPADENQYNDIALLRLAQGVEFTDYIKPICLPVGSLNTTFEDYVVEVAGWGEIESHAKSDVKLKASAPVVEASQCSQIVARDINGKQLCAGGAKQTDTCNGDYGGALMAHAPAVNWLAIGLASYRPLSCKSPEFPTVYTRIGAYIDWIVSKMKP